MTNVRRILAGCLILAGIVWLFLIPRPLENKVEAAQVVTQLVPGTVARMDSPPFAYTPGWSVDASGADPAEPSDPFTTPSGVISFTYQGSEVALLLATGDYWGYLYASVDGAPANQLAVIAGNLDSEGKTAGYKTFYEPENQSATGPGVHWIRIHTAPSPNLNHQVQLEVWRSWGQQPIRAVAIDALPATALPRWPGMLLILLAGIVLLSGWRNAATEKELNKPQLIPAEEDRWLSEKRAWPGWFTLGLALIGVFLAAAGAWDALWWLTLVGIGMLAAASLIEPVLWLAALLFALPFYFAFPLPLLPGRSLGIIDVGVLGGIVVLAANFVLATVVDRRQGRVNNLERKQWWEIDRFPILALIVGWALVSTFAADKFSLALREWRTVFLAALLFSLLLQYVKRKRSNLLKPLFPEQTILVSAWLLGATAVALIGLWAYLTHYEAYLVGAEGVTRLRSVYGSPNNLAAYLDRSLAVTLAFALFARSRRLQILAATLALPQALAFLLTFSKGGTFLGLPVMLVVLAIGGTIVLRAEGRSTRLLWGLAAVVLVAALALVPVLGAERFRGLLDPSSATSFMRINLWRSSWQMALDHWLLGVGPDNFLYTYRSNYLLPAAWKEPNLNHPHNFLLDWWTRLGVPGLVLGLFWWGSITRRLSMEIRWFHHKDRRVESTPSLTPHPSPLLTLGLLAAVAASLAHGLIDISYALPDLMIVWVLMDEVG
ncbi:MAG: O-antigen ligase family protein [Caldilineaceae bacterium]